MRIFAIALLMISCAASASDSATVHFQDAIVVFTDCVAEQAVFFDDGAHRGVVSVPQTCTPVTLNTPGIIPDLDPDQFQLQVGMNNQALDGCAMLHTYRTAGISDTVLSCPFAAPAAKYKLSRYR